MPGAYRKDIDGLRGVAVLSVVFFHLNYVVSFHSSRWPFLGFTSNAFSGGFVGVDVFFVISGFLIAGIIAMEMDCGGFSFLGFYQRRIRRILPALLVVSLATTIVAGLLFPPVTFVAFAQSLFAMATIRSNSFFANSNRQLGYFANDQDPLPLLHTWSLSVEEQFYLLFPIGMLLLFRFFPSSRVRVLFGSLVLSFALSVWQTHHHPVAAFYLLPSRGWELLLGAFFATATLPAIPRAGREIVALFGLFAICFSVLHYTSGTSFPGVNALSPCLGTALILYAGKYGGSLTNRALRFQPLVWIGLISYSLYLWHWPIIVFHRYIFDMFRTYNPSPRTILAIFLISVTLAALSYRFVERPFRGSSSRFSDRQVIGFAAISFLTLVTIGLVVSTFNGFPNRFDPLTRHILAENSTRPDDWVRLGDCTNYHTNPKKYSDLTFCEIHHSSRNILFWGDSHIQQLYPLIERLEQEQKLDGRGAVFAISAGCPSMERTDLPGGFHCDAFTRFARQRALQDDIDTVFLESTTSWQRPGALCVVRQNDCTPFLSGPEEVKSMMIDLSGRVHQLRSAGKRVIVGLPFPIYDEDPSHYEIIQARLGRFINISAPHQAPDVLRSEFEKVARQEGAEIYDPRASLCPGRSCIYEIDHLSIYQDASHLAASQLDILQDDFLDVLNRKPIPSVSP